MRTSTFMKPLLLTAALAAILFASGCMIYKDNPPKRTISGQVVRSDNGQPVPYAVIWFYSERVTMGMATNFGIDATAYADRDGKFNITARLNDKVTVVVFHNGVVEKFVLPEFPADNTLSNIVWGVHEDTAAPIVPRR